METNKPNGWPHGAGTISKRGSVYWMKLRDASGEEAQINSGTGDATEAYRRLAPLAIESYMARIAVLQDFLHETAPKADTREGRAHDDAGHAARRRPVRDDAAKRGNRRAARGGKK